MYIDHFHEIIDCIFGYSLIICFSQFLLTLPQKYNMAEIHERLVMDAIENLIRLQTMSSKN